MNPVLITISGPTAVGKTSFAIDLAEKLTQKSFPLTHDSFIKK